MKARIHLLLLVLVLMLVVVSIAACGDTPAETTPAATTTESATTTAGTAATTTAAVTTATTTGEPSGPSGSGNPLPGVEKMELKLQNTVYTGKAIAANNFTVANRPRDYVNAVFTWERIDADGNRLEDLGSGAPVEAGRYRVTASFTWRNSKTEEAYSGTYVLPDPLTGILIVEADDLTTTNKNFGAIEDTLEMFYYDGIAYEPTAEEILTGTLPTGLVPSYKIEYVKDSAGNDVTAEVVTAPSKPGYFKITVSYAEVEGKDNYAKEDQVKHEAMIRLREIDKQVLKYDGVVIDGVIDEAYKSSASYTTSFQGMEGNALTDPMVDPFAYAAMYELMKPKDTSAQLNLSATFYALWGDKTVNGEAVPYVYIAVEINDPTNYARSKDYAELPNPWLNDGLELHYKFGGYEIPTFDSTATAIYPTYSTVVGDSRDKTSATDQKAFSAVAAQKSLYFSEIESATKRVDDDTYVIEYAFPAKSESFDGKPGYDGFQRTEGEALTAGEFLFLAYQINDLTYLPDGYDDTLPEGPKYPNEYTYSPVAGSPWDNFEKGVQPNMYIVANGYTYLKNGGKPMMFQLSAEEYVINVDATDGAKDEDYENKGIHFVGQPANDLGEVLDSAPAGYNTMDVYTIRSIDGTKLYLYVAVTDTEVTEDDFVDFAFGEAYFDLYADGTIEGTMTGVSAVKDASFSGGYAYEITVDLTANDGLTPNIKIMNFDDDTAGLTYVAASGVVR